MDEGHDNLCLTAMNISFLINMDDWGRYHDSLESYRSASAVFCFMLTEKYALLPHIAKEIIKLSRLRFKSSPLKYLN